MAAAVILDFTYVQYFGIRECRTWNLIQVPNFVQICAIVNALRAINKIQNGGRRHFEFIIFVHFGQMVYFRWQSSTLLPNIIHLRQSAAELVLFVKNPRWRPPPSCILSVQYFGIFVCRTSSVIHVPNFVEICAILNELWVINDIQHGGSRHLEFIIFVHFGQMVHFRWQPSTLLQNFIHLRQSAVVLLMFMQKSKMAAADILDFIFV